MGSRIWFLLGDLLERKRKQDVDENLGSFSEEELETVQPYVEHVSQIALFNPTVAAIMYATLGIAGTVAVLGGMIKYALRGQVMIVPFCLLALPVTVYLAYKVPVKVYRRKEKQCELYDTLLEEPQRLLDEGYRSQFDDLLLDPPDGSDDSADADKHPEAKSSTSDI